MEQQGQPYAARRERPPAPTRRPSARRPLAEAPRARPPRSQPPSAPRCHARTPSERTRARSAAHAPPPPPSPPAARARSGARRKRRGGARSSTARHARRAARATPARGARERPPARHAALRREAHREGVCLRPLPMAGGGCRVQARGARRLRTCGALLRSTAPHRAPVSPRGPPPTSERTSRRQAAGRLRPGSGAAHRPQVA